MRAVRLRSELARLGLPEVVPLSPAELIELEALRAEFPVVPFEEGLGSVPGSQQSQVLQEQGAASGVAFGL